MKQVRNLRVLRAFVVNKNNGIVPGYPHGNLKTPKGFSGFPVGKMLKRVSTTKDTKNTKFKIMVTRTLRALRDLRGLKGFRR
jgi:hypothetical protein